MDGTGLAPVPDKARGHLSGALNATCPVIQAISSQYCTPFHLLCATVATTTSHHSKPVNPRTPLRVGIHCHVFPGSASSPS